MPAGPHPTLSTDDDADDERDPGGEAAREQARSAPLASSACCCSSRCWSTPTTCSSSRPSELNDDAPQPAGHRGGVLPRARADPGRRRPGRARACRSTTSSSSCDATRSRSYAHVTGFFSCYLRPDRDRATPERVLSGSDARLFVNRVIDLLRQHQPKGGSVSLTLNPAAQQAAFDGLQALGPDVQGAVVALDPSTGAILAMVSLAVVRPEPAGHARLRRRARETYDALNADPDRAAAQPRDPGDLPAGLDVQAGHRGRGAEHGYYTPTSMVPGGATLDLPQTTDTASQQRAARAAAASEITFDRGARASPATSRSASSASSSAPTRCRSRPRRSASTSTTSTSSAGQAESRVPDDLDEPQTAQSAIGQFDVRGHPAADGDGGGRHRQRRRRDEALPRRRGARRPTSTCSTRPSRAELHQAVSPASAARADRDDGRRSVERRHRHARRRSPASRSPARPAPRRPRRGPAAVRLVRLVRPGRRPRGRGGGADRGRRQSRRDEITGGGLAAPIAKAVMEAVLPMTDRRRRADPRTDRHEENPMTEPHRRRDATSSASCSAAAAWPRSARAPTSGSAASSRSSGCAPTWPATRPSRPGSAARRSRRRR